MLYMLIFKKHCCRENDQCVNGSSVWLDSVGKEQEAGAVHRARSAFVCVSGLLGMALGAWCGYWSGKAT